MPLLNGSAISSQLSPQMVIGGVLAAAVFVLFVLLVIFLAARPSKKAEVKPLSPEEMQAKHIKDLKDALVRELRGTSKQNTIMIILTIIFILVTVFGGSIFIFINKVPAVALAVAKFIKSLSGK